MSDIICKTLVIAGQTIELIASTADKVFCYFQLKSWSKAKFFGKPEKAITDISEQLGDAGASIDSATALEAINAQVVAIIPQLTILKSSANVALTEITELHPIDQISLSIGIQIKSNNDLGPVKIDGIGFRIQTTKED
jgi:hypothetical protein